MIPSGYAAKTPFGEKELFDKIVADPGTAGWVVLHSLDVKKHRSKIEGEVDLVILVPALGVLCVEVKGCDVSRQDGKWIYPYETSTEGPFKQVSRASHSLRDYVEQKETSLSKILFFSAVVFTRVNFEDESPEWHPWQYVNRRKLIRQPISKSVTEILQRAHAHFKSKVSQYAWYHEEKTRPTETQISRLVGVLRADFDYPASPRSDVENIEEGIRHFTEEQFDALDLLDENPRVVFKGLAGTGKTLLAIEAARRARANGKSTLLLCYNKLLGRWLERQTHDLALGTEKFWCGTFHRLLLDIAGCKPPASAGNEYWRNLLPPRVADLLLDDQRTWPSYDMIVIDEAQDLLNDEYLDVIDLLLRGGLAGGQWVMFGDFAKQAIYASDVGQLANQLVGGLVARSPNHVKSTLSINCRNAEPIAGLLTIASGLNPGYKRVLHDMAGADVTPLFFSTADGQHELLRRALGELTKTFKPEEIVVLSMRANERSCSAAATETLKGIHLLPMSETRDAAAVEFTSVHAFKGMEASAIVITDIEKIDDDRTQALLYVGMSRARIVLYMLMSESCRASYNRMLDAGLEIATRRT